MAINLDDLAATDSKLHPNSVVGWILLASFAYYHRDENILSDSLFDYLCSTALIDWDKITHRFKHLITKEDMKAGSCYSIKQEDYPYGIIRCLDQQMIELNKRRKEDK